MGWHWCIMIQVFSVCFVLFLFTSVGSTRASVKTQRQCVHRIYCGPEVLRHKLYYPSGTASMISFYGAHSHSKTGI